MKSHKLHVLIDFISLWEVTCTKMLEITTMPIRKKQLQIHLYLF